ncbi:hypothetical protein [Nitrospira sp. Nam74]
MDARNRARLPLSLGNGDNGANVESDIRGQMVKKERKDLDPVEKRLKNMPKALIPRYKTKALNKPISLYRGPLHLHLPREENPMLMKKAEIALRYLPQCKVAFNSNLNSSLPISPGEVTISAPGVGLPFKVWITKSNWKNGIAFLEGVFLEPFQTQSDSAAHRVLFPLKKFS